MSMEEALDSVLKEIESMTPEEFSKALSDASESEWAGVFQTVQEMSIFYYNEFLPKLKGRPMIYSEWEDDIVCPYCQYVNKDSWEHNGDDGKTISCGNCDKDFVVHVDLSVSYATSKLEADQ